MTRITGRFIRVIGVVAMCLAAASTARAQAAPQTSVLCIWEMLVSVSAIAEACNYDQGSDFNRAISESIERLDEFILAHADFPNAPALFKRKKQELRAAHLDDVTMAAANGVNACDPSGEYGSLGVYIGIAEARTPEQLRAEIEAALALPRENPFAGICV